MNLNNTNVFSRLSNLVQSGFLNFARFINHITCNIHVEWIYSDFSTFSKAYANVYGWRTDTGSAANTLKGALFMFIAFKRMHCSELFSYMQSTQLDFRFPEFVHCIFETVVQNVKSFTANNSYVVGNIVVTGVKLDDIIIELRTHAELQDTDFFLKIFSGSGLESNFMHARVRESFYALLIHECNYYLNDVNISDTIDRNYFSLIFVNRAFEKVEQYTSISGLSRLNIVIQKYKQGSSQHLSIYRFMNVQNASDQCEYQVNVKSLDGLSDAMFKLFISFLFIFRPRFSLISVVVAGYEPFGFSGVNESIHWELYLGCQRVKPTPRRFVVKTNLKERVPEIRGNDNDDVSNSNFVDVSFVGNSTIYGKVSSIVSLLSANKTITSDTPIILIINGP
jgi:hypothetical protein